jgi:hypothetical protein
VSFPLPGPTDFTRLCPLQAVDIRTLAYRYLSYPQEMESAFNPRTLISLAIIFALLSCNSEKTKIVPCPDNEQFSALMNDKCFASDRKVTGTYYKKKLKFNALDSVISNGVLERFLIEFDLKNTAIGMNNIDNQNSTSNAALRHWSGDSFSAYGAASGEVVLTKFDTIAGRFSGTFNFEIDRPEHGIHYSITEGKFNNIEIRKNYCDPDYILKSPDSISLFNYWWVVGFTNEDESISDPPCDYYGRLKFTPDPLNKQGIRIEGGYVNSFKTYSEPIDSNRFYIGFFPATRIGIAIPWVSKFESEYFNFLRDDTITYRITNDQLILSNTKTTSKLVLTTIEGVNER